MMNNMGRPELEALVKENPTDMIKAIQGLNKFVQDKKSSENFNNQQNEVHCFIEFFLIFLCKMKSHPFLYRFCLQYVT